MSDHTPMPPILPRASRTLGRVRRYGTSMSVEFLEPAAMELRSTSYAQAVRLGSRVETSGQGGWTRARKIPSDLAAEVAQAFDNVADVLASASASWDDVVAMTSYHVQPEADGIAATSAELRRRRTRADGPAWTSVGVPMLGPDMHIEIKVTAIVDAESAPPLGHRERNLMARPEFITPGRGQGWHDRIPDQQLVRIGDRIETSTHGGWTDGGEIPSELDHEILQAFDNIERTLRAADSSWSDVIGLDSYHLVLNEEVFWLMSDQLRERIPTHTPIWTCVGVTSLTDSRMRIGIRVTAIVHESAGNAGTL